MKRQVILASVVLAAGSLFAADPKDEVVNAAKKLADSPSYSWKQTTENANAGGGGGGGFAAFGNAPVEGKADKGGLAYTVTTFNFNGDETKFERVSKGTNSAMNRGEGWQTAAEMAAQFGGGGGGGGGRRGGGFNAAIVTPASQAQDMVKQVKEFKESGGAYVGELTEDGAKSLASPFGRGGRGGRAGGGGGGGGFTPPEITGAKGTVSFWVKDGVLSKYVLKVQGKTTDFNGDPQDINRTTTVEIKAVGSTKIDVPEDIKKKLE